MIKLCIVKLPLDKNRRTDKAMLSICYGSVHDKYQCVGTSCVLQIRKHTMKLSQVFSSNKFKLKKVKHTGKVLILYELRHT